MKKLFSILSVVAFVLFMTACEGPEGPAGPQGPAGKDGKDGKDASVACAVCHSDNATATNLAFAQFNYSLHKTGETYAYTAGRAGCGDCHNGDGFRKMASTNTWGQAGITALDCKTCHNIHKNLDETDYALRITQPFTLIYKGSAADGNVDFKTGNLCATCHQARSYARNSPNFDTLTAASSTAMYSRFGPHYGTVANVFAGKGLNFIEGSETYPTGNPHSVLAKGCVSCHMGSNPTAPAAGGHSFKMTVAQMSTIESCRSCHPSGIPTTKTNEIKTLLAEYRQLLIDKGLLIATAGNPGDPDYNVLGEYAKLEEAGKRRVIPRSDGDVLLNYLYIARDRSNGAHNPGLTLAILKNGLAYLKN